MTSLALLVMVLVLVLASGLGIIGSYKILPLRVEISLTYLTLYASIVNIYAICWHFGLNGELLSLLYGYSVGHLVDIAFDLIIFLHHLCKYNLKLLVSFTFTSINDYNVSFKGFLLGYVLY